MVGFQSTIGHPWASIGLIIYTRAILAPKCRLGPVSLISPMLQISDVEILIGLFYILPLMYPCLPILLDLRMPQLRA